MICRMQHAPVPLIIRFMLNKQIIPCDPEGQFEGSRLLDGSISLSPLYNCMTNDLHVSLTVYVHIGFL